MNPYGQQLTTGGGCAASARVGSSLAGEAPESPNPHSIYEGTPGESALGRYPRNNYKKEPDWALFVLKPKSLGQPGLNGLSAIQRSDASNYERYRPGFPNISAGRIGYGPD